MTDLMLRDSNLLNSFPAFRQFNNAVAKPFNFSDVLLSTNAGPAVSIYETQDEYILEAELPGWKREEVEVDFENNVLTLSGSRELSQLIGRNYLRIEGLTDGFSRSFTVSSAIDAGRVAAELEGGVLTVHLPKRAEAKPRQIKITTVQ